MRLIAFACLFLLGYSYIFGQKYSENNSSTLSDSAVKLWKENKYDEALLTINKSLEIAGEFNDSLQMAKCLNNIGLIYISKGDPVKSIFYYEQSLKILRLLRSDDNVATSLLNLGIAYKEQAIYDKSLRYLLEAVEYFENIKEVKKQSAAYNAIGNIFRVEKNYGEALNYLNKALKLRKDIGFVEGIAGSLNSIGVVFKETKKYDSALIYFEQSLQKALISSPPSEHYANTLSYVAEIYKEKGNYKLAKDYYDSAFSIRKGIDSKKGMAYSMLELGSLYFTTKEFSKSETYLNQSIDFAQSIEASDVLLKCYGILRKLYRSIGKYQKALEYDDLYITLNEHLLGEEKFKSLAQMQIKYETEKKQDEIENLNREKKIREALLLAKELQLESKRIYNRNLVIAVIALIVFAILVVIVLRQRNRVLKQQELVLMQQNEFAAKLDAVMREVHHRVKNNFQVLLALFDLQLNHINDPAAREFIKSNSNRITSMMLIHSDLYINKEITSVKIASHIQSLVDNLITAYELNKQNIKIDYDIDEKINLSFDNAISVGLLVNELVTNSFKYAFGENNSAPHLVIEFNKTTSHVLIIKDNCPNSDKIDFKKSFGLKVVKTQVNHLKGTMDRNTEHGVEYTIRF